MSGHSNSNSEPFLIHAPSEQDDALYKLIELPRPAFGPDTVVVAGAIERGRTLPRIGIARRGSTSSTSSTNSTEGSGSGASDSDLNVRSASQSSLDRFSEAGSEKSADSSLSSFSREEQNLSRHHLAARRLVLPELDLTGRVTKSDIYPVDSGGAADIYEGILGQSKLAIKIYRRMHSELHELELKSISLYDAARRWKPLDHPNVLPFLGISQDLGLSPALITPLCSSGPVMKYLKVNAKDPIQRLQIVTGITEGLVYLHSQEIIHGNLCTKKILINDAGLPLICSYGMFNILGPSAISTSLFSSPIRFAAPEYFSDVSRTSSIRTKAGDVYALSMVILEILSGLEPFHHLPTEHAVFMHILQGNRPIRTHLDPHVVTKRIWSFLTLLWNQDPSFRPAMPDVLASLMQIRNGEHMKDEVSEPGSPEATSAVDKEDNSSSGEETSFEETSHPGFPGRDLKGRVKQDDPYPFAGGGNSNVYRGKLSRSDGTKIRVAIKMIRMSDDGSGQQELMLRRLKREVDVWSRLKHKNVLPFIGVCEDLAPLPVLISPFYKFGHVGKYLRKHPKVDRAKLSLGVGSGLQFLHDKKVVHGDLKVQNVLVDKHGVPCICDFGISKIVSLRGFTTSNVGTAPYMAPELFLVIDDYDSSSQESSAPCTTTSSDVYSFALLVLEILTAGPPKGRPTKPIVTRKTLSSLRPKRADYDEKRVSQRTWSILDGCWSFEPHLRPTVSELLSGLTDSFASSMPMEASAAD
ncbi:kinase-like domain-containing protein [Mycena galopus ATCC 62051]|nr:kinase-like domain-containing protein [Mycena galopus ATCC 62051]